MQVHRSIAHHWRVAGSSSKLHARESSAAIENRRNYYSWLLEM